MERQFKRIPKHIGIIPDGNRRWALQQSMEKHQGYEHGIEPGFEIVQMMIELGIQETTFYGFTMDNTKRAANQKDAFTAACIQAVERLAHQDANLLVIGNSDSSAFPKELIPYANHRVCFGKGLININFLVNYDWKWDLNYALQSVNRDSKPVANLYEAMASQEISRIDFIIRWGGRNRLSGFLPIQSVYSDFFVLEEYWPEFNKEQFYRAMDWYQNTDITLGG